MKHLLPLIVAVGISNAAPESVVYPAVVPCEKAGKVIPKFVTRE